VILTGDQEAAVRTLVGFLRDREAPTARLTGFAGCGKTTLIGLLARVAEKMGRNVAVLTPTGKAALRVTEATGLPASTIHRFLYKPSSNQETGDVTFVVQEPETFEGWGNGLVIVDEASMLGAEVWRHLRGLADDVGFKILLVGDPFQLEPVERPEEGRVFSFLNVATAYAPHLTEIVRQKADDPIIRASMLLRTESGPWAVTNALSLLPSLTGSPAKARARDADTPVICHTNATRHKINKEVRATLGYDELPQREEPLLVLKNNYALDRYNGEVVTIAGWVRPPDQAVRISVLDRKTNIAGFLSYARADIEGSDKTAIVCLEEIAGETHGKIGEYWIGKGAKQAWKEMAPGEAEVDESRPPYLSANFGYCLTAHKAQGSEWDNVIVVGEGNVMNGDVSSRRWLYTSLTRAKKGVRWTTL
jgi:exodeoxyribonuclease V